MSSLVGECTKRSSLMAQLPTINVRLFLSQTYIWFQVSPVVSNKKSSMLFPLLISRESKVETLTCITTYSILVQKSVIVMLWFMRTQLVLHNCVFSAIKFPKSIIEWPFWIKLIFFSDTQVNLVSEAPHNTLLCKLSDFLLHRNCSLWCGHYRSQYIISSSLCVKGTQGNKFFAAFLHQFHCLLCVCFHACINVRTGICVISVAMPFTAVDEMILVTHAPDWDAAN